MVPHPSSSNEQQAAGTALVNALSGSFLLGMTSEVNQTSNVFFGPREVSLKE